MRYFLLIITIISVSQGEELPFKIGEKLIYSVKFNIIPSGTASLEVLARDTINGKGTYHARFTARTNQTFDRLFKIRDQIDIWMDDKDLYTHQLNKSILEGNYSKNLTTSIFYNDSLAIINY